MELAEYKAVICEGASEETIMNILLDEHLLIFEREELIEESVLRCRNAKTFESRHLRKSFKSKISVIRVLDSRKERFKISKEYIDKIDVVNIITAPEIEMLIIHAEDRYDEYKRSGKKPSAFCKEDLRIHNVKSVSFVETYFRDTEKLLRAIKLYDKKASKRAGELSILDLVKESKKY